MSSVIFYVLLLVLAGIFVMPVAGLVLLLAKKQRLAIFAFIACPACMVVGLLIGIFYTFASAHIAATVPSPSVTTSVPTPVPSTHVGVEPVPAQ